MIGLVVVSHSRPLARAAVALATELLPAQPVRVEIAAGLDDHTLGTDAVAVADAITAADSGAGVLLLMDLGSAILSAETALELLDAPHEVRLCAAPLVEGLVAALAAAGGGADLAATAREAEHALDAKRAQLGAPPGGPAADDHAGSDTLIGRPQADAVFEVTNEHGLHARPAAELVSALGALDAEVLLRNATTGAGPVPGNSLTRVLTLGVLPGHRLEVAATGPEAALAIEQVRAVTSGR
ncbi:dihydroxyacetone kinase phosphoryl donor subunit DhaM [Nocardia yamanashiensis]|uniref:dihydroxyacetone kinase phosphoryl donor subunit DhaM n=1 Tax=Nocardia yamanashiensis TaxID=209247 RepID=UPI000829F8D0|nr:dihydroxyacetone kinase phosphoryl donor subunit DhaM [Nocardia yamanashiensis]